MDSNVIKRTPPHSIEAEQSVIGAMLMDKDALIYASEHIKSDNFFVEKYKILFEAIVELNMKNQEVDFVTLQNKLREKKASPEICEIGFINSIIDAVPSSAAIKQYCDIVADKSTLRRLIKTSEDVANKCYSGADSTEELLNQAEKGVYDIRQEKRDDEFTPISEVVMNTLENIQIASKTSGNVTGIPSGFPDLDFRTAGFHGSELILIAARPAMGKTAFVLNIAEYAAVKKNYKVAIFSLEMSKESLVSRMIAMNSNVDSQLIRTGNLSDTDWDRVVESGDFIAKSGLMIHDTAAITVNEMRSRCRKMKMDYGLDMIIIDYLQLMNGSGRASESRQNEISTISRSLKVLARELDVPVLALSQLSREVEKRPDHRPMLSDLRESGAIEQDADMVMFIYRDDYYNPDTERKNIAEIIIAKQRNGAVGSVDLVWLPEYTKFGSLDRRDKRHDNQ